MLYVTTRGQADVHTAHWAMNHEADHGQLIPRQFPVPTEEELAGIPRRSFSQNVAWVLELLYQVRISAWDVEMALGKYPLDLVDLNTRTRRSDSTGGRTHLIKL